MQLQLIVECSHHMMHQSYPVDDDIMTMIIQLVLFADQMYLPSNSSKQSPSYDRNGITQQW
jgi:hypothetical protein